MHFACVPMNLATSALTLRECVAPEYLPEVDNIGQ